MVTHVQIESSIDSFVDRLLRFGTRLRYQRKMRKMRKAGIPATALADRQGTIQRLHLLQQGYRDLRWHESYAAATGREFSDYVPEDIFYARIEPMLNQRRSLAPIADKNNYDLLPWPKRPLTLARVIQGRLTDRDYRPISLDELARLAKGSREIVVKPSKDSGGGKGVAFLKPSDLCAWLDGRQMRNDVIIQRVLGQSKQVARFHPDSLNTFRITTYRTSTGEVVHLSSVFRMGRGGSRVDNQAAGGIVCGIDEHGALGSFAVDKAFGRFDKHPDSGIAFAGVTLPPYVAAREAALASHRVTPWADLCSWDFAIDTDDNPVVIELNTVEQEINFHQLCNGPLFGKYLDDVVMRLKGG